MGWIVQMTGKNNNAVRGASPLLMLIAYILIWGVKKGDAVKTYPVFSESQIWNNRAPLIMAGLYYFPVQMWMAPAVGYILKLP
jgi:hypothetical protein